eukprot:s4171_g2.t1
MFAPEAWPVGTYVPSAWSASTGKRGASAYASCARQVGTWSELRDCQELRSLRAELNNDEKITVLSMAIAGLNPTAMQALDGLVQLGASKQAAVSLRSEIQFVLCLRCISAWIRFARTSPAFRRVCHMGTSQANDERAARREARVSASRSFQEVKLRQTAHSLGSRIEKVGSKRLLQESFSQRNQMLAASAEQVWQLRSDAKKRSMQQAERWQRDNDSILLHLVMGRWNASVAQSLREMRQGLPMIAMARARLRGSALGLAQSSVSFRSHGLWRWRFHLACAGFCSFLAPLRSCYGARRNFVTAVPFQPRARNPGSAPTARRIVNEAGFEVGVMMSPEEADRLGLKPFGDGGAENETSPRRPKFYTHGPCRSPAAAQFVVSCAGFDGADEAEQRRIAAEATEKMKTNGFVVLESLLPQEWVAKLEAEAAAFLDLPQPGLIPQPLRAGRTEGHLSFTAPWASDWLLRNELVLEVVAGYMNNNLAAGRTQDEQQWGLVQWLTSGASLDWFSMPEWGPKAGSLLEEPPPGCSDVGTHVETGPFFGRISLIRTPPGSEPQKHHRDINFPGPAAQVTAQVALTQLHANNGPLAYVPGSHRMLTPGFEVVAAPPLGSVVLYDSFCEHRGIEHHGNKDRYAMYYEFETRAHARFPGLRRPSTSGLGAACWLLAVAALTVASSMNATECSRAEHE